MPRESMDAPEPPRLQSRSRPKWIGGFALLIAVLALALGFSMGFETLADASFGSMSRLWSALSSAPAPIFFGIMSVALLAPVPASVFYLTAGPIYGIGPSLLWTAPTLAVNALLIHVIASSWLRPLLEAVMIRNGRALPRMRSSRDQTLLILVVRITPGIPYFVQNWLLGLSGVKRTPFILLSVGIQMVYATGFIVLGRSAFEGRIGLAIGAVALLLVAALLARIAHGKLSSEVGTNDASTSETPE